MRRSSARVAGLSLAALLGLAAIASPALAVEEFFEGFKAKYVKPKSEKEGDVLLVAAVEQARCSICHPGEDTHRLTSYGSLVNWRINKYDKDKKKKIQEALKEVGALKVNSKDPKSPTYEELFREGQLPPASEQ